MYFATRKTNCTLLYNVPEQLKYCQSLNVHTCTNIVDRYKVHGLLSMKRRMSDHLIIVTEINVGETNDYVSEDVCPNREQVNTSDKRYSFDNMPFNFMKSDAWTNINNFTNG